MLGLVTPLIATPPYEYDYFRNFMFRLAVQEVLPRDLCFRTMARAVGRTKLLNVETMNPNVRVMEYAVRGKVPLEAMKIKQELEQASVKFLVA